MSVKMIMPSVYSLLVIYLYNEGSVSCIKLLRYLLFCCFFEFYMLDLRSIGKYMSRDS